MAKRADRHQLVVTMEDLAFSSSGTTADGSSHSEAGGGAVEAQVKRAVPGLMARDYGFIARPAAAAATAAARFSSKNQQLQQQQ